MSVICLRMKSIVKNDVEITYRTDGSKKLVYFSASMQRAAGMFAFLGDLLRAFRPDPDLKRGGILLDLYGHGPEEAKLRRLAEGAENIRFHDFVPVEQVRELMRNHDIHVLPSNAYEGWGAVVSEALEEGMCVLASIESGAGATLLPPENLFPAGKWREIMMKVITGYKRPSTVSWSIGGAVTWMMRCGC